MINMHHRFIMHQIGATNLLLLGKSQDSLYDGPLSTKARLPKMIDSIKLHRRALFNANILILLSVTNLNFDLTTKKMNVHVLDLHVNCMRFDGTQKSMTIFT